MAPERAFARMAAEILDPQLDSSSDTISPIKNKISKQVSYTILCTSLCYLKIPLVVILLGEGYPKRFF